MTMTVDTDALYGDLHAARERLCRAQTLLEHDGQRQLLQEALDRIDQVGVFLPQWSKYDEPGVIDLRDDPPPTGWLNPPGRP